MKHKYAVRQCVLCPNEYRPTRRDQRACSFRCARALAGQTLKALGTPAALTRQQQINADRRRARVEGACRARFGSLTARESSIYAAGRADGYNAGYARGYHAQRQPQKGRVAR